MPGSTPEERITGRKKITRQRVLPLKSWFRITAMTKLITRVAIVLIAMRPISLTSILEKSGSETKA